MVTLKRLCGAATTTPGTTFPRTITLGTTTHRATTPWDNYPDRTTTPLPITPKNNYPLLDLPLRTPIGQLPLLVGQLPLRTTNQILRKLYFSGNNSCLLDFEIGSKLKISPFFFNHLKNSNNPKILSPFTSQ